MEKFSFVTKAFYKVQQPSAWESAPNPFHQKGRSMVAMNAYVPAGFTEAEWKKRQASDAKLRADKSQANAKKRAKGWEDLDEWISARDAKFPGTVGKGHTFVKTKFDWSGGSKTGTTKVTKQEPAKKSGFSLFGTK